MILKGGLERRLSSDVEYLQSQAKVVLKSLEKFSENYILPVNISKTKAMIIHTVVKVKRPVLKYEKKRIKYVSSFRCLRVEIGTKLGMGKNIEARLKKVRSSYAAMRQLFRTIPKNEI